MIPPDARPFWVVYERENLICHGVYSLEVSNHGSRTVPHLCSRPECRSQDQNMRNLLRRGEAA
jgi:hypothetical protein